MSASDAASEIAEFAGDGVADKLHVVSEEAQAMEKAARSMDGLQIAYIGLGVAVGAAIGGFVGFRVAYARAEEKYSKFAAEEIAEMRDHYYAKEVARENAEEKGELETIVRERGYAPEPDEDATRPPMAVTPPEAVVDRAAEVAESEDEVAGEPPDEPVDDAPEPVTRNVFRDNEPPEDVWDWHKERAQRSPLRPYVIHLEERDDAEPYSGVTYTYYEADDVVCNERDEVLDEAERERIIGEANLSKFGHGSDDRNIVYVRNDQLEMDMEIIRSPNSYAEEVHGFAPEIKHSHRRRGRAPTDDG
jgi:hypothetical protein